MTERLYRAQILLEPKQHYELRAIADREHRSISEVAREIIGEGLVRRKGDTEKRLEALEALRTLRGEVEHRYSVTTVDILADARAERDAQLDQAIFGDRP